MIRIRLGLTPDPFVGIGERACEPGIHLFDFPCEVFFDYFSAKAQFRRHFTLLDREAAGVDLAGRRHRPADPVRHCRLRAVRDPEVGGGEVVGSGLGQARLVIDHGVGLQNIGMRKVAEAVVGVREARPFGYGSLPLAALRHRQSILIKREGHGDFLNAHR